MSENKERMMEETRSFSEREKYPSVNITSRLFYSCDDDDDDERISPEDDRVIRSHPFLW